MKWHKESEGFWRSGCGRFDIIESTKDEGFPGFYYYVIDSVAGKTTYQPDFDSAKLWCERLTQSKQTSTILQAS